MKTLVVFSPKSDTLAETIHYLAALEVHCVWIPIEDWRRRWSEVVSVDGVIVDEVDQSFRWRDEVDYLEQTLIGLPLSLQRLFLVDVADHHLDHVDGRGGNAIHRRNDPKYYERLRRLIERSPQLVGAA